MIYKKKYIIYRYYSIMANKTISLPLETYDKLRKEKRKGESFAGLINRLLKRTKSKTKLLEDLAGVFKDDDEWDRIIEEIYKDRKTPARI
jgi:predicted CopG family antitoxin